MTGAPSRLMRLVAIAREDSGEKRRELLSELTEIFVAESGRHSPTEMQHFDAILSLVARRADIDLRRELAQKIAEAPAAPAGLIAHLALDDIGVAEPILRRSPALTEDVILSFIHEASQAHLEALARRRGVTRAVAEELARRGGRDVLLALASNREADLSPETMAALVARARTAFDLQAPLAARYDLPAPLMTQMFFFVSSPLKKEILKRTDLLDPSLVAAAIKDNRKRLLAEPEEPAPREIERARAFLGHCVAQGGPSPAALAELLTAARAIEFLYVFSWLAGVDAVTGERILADPSFETLAIASRAARIDEQQFAAAVRTLAASPEQDAAAPRILELYERLPHEAAERIMRVWRVRAAAAEPQGVRRSAIAFLPERRRSIAS